jgi:hypothetical protein
MPIVDEHGRLFGRFNVLDAIVAVLVLGLIPLGYAAFVLFRAPLPVLTKVEPAATPYSLNLRITVRGENLRPYMRVSLDKYQGQSFLFKDTTEAEVEIRNVPPGVYDVVLFDYAQERSRLRKAFEIQPSPLPDAKVVVVGTFGNLAPGQADRITVGMTIPEIGEVLAVGKPVPQVARVFARPGTVEIPLPNAQMLPAIVRIGCFVRAAQGQPECVGGGFSMQPTTLLFLPTPIGTVPFQIDQVRSPLPLMPLDIAVRFSGPAEALAQLKAGDVDLGDVRNELAAGASVTSVTAAGPATRDARLTVQAQQGAATWVYGTAPLRIGGPFAFKTATYELSGTVIGLMPRPGGAR